MLPRLPTRVYETLAPVVTPIMGRPGWTAALGEGLAAALPRETLTHREKALLRNGAASVNDALKRLKAPPRWADACVLVASENDAVLPSVREARRLPDDVLVRAPACPQPRRVASPARVRVAALRHEPRASLSAVGTSLRTIWLNLTPDGSVPTLLWT